MCLVNAEATLPTPGDSEWVKGGRTSLSLQRVVNANISTQQNQFFPYYGAQLGRSELSGRAMVLSCENPRCMHPRAHHSKELLSAWSCTLAEVRQVSCSPGARAGFLPCNLEIWESQPSSRVASSSNCKNFVSFSFFPLPATSYFGMIYLSPIVTQPQFQYTAWPVTLCMCGFVNSVSTEESAHKYNKLNRWLQQTCLWVGEMP